jgi:hypothetical protein
VNERDHAHGGHYGNRNAATPRTADLVAAQDQQELIADVFRRELTPHVREAITEDVIKGIAAMATLSEELVTSLAADLRSEDAVARGRAQALMSKYLFGQINPDEQRGGLTINMPAMPTPDAPDHGDAVVVEAEELRACERCGVEKPLSAFEPAAPRCNECQAELRASIQERHGISVD